MTVMIRFLDTPENRERYKRLAAAHGMSLGKYGRLALRNLRVQMEAQASE